MTRVIWTFPVYMYSGTVNYSLLASKHCFDTSRFVTKQRTPVIRTLPRTRYSIYPAHLQSAEPITGTLIPTGFT
jgi:hypothetical protein